MKSIAPWGLLCFILAISFSVANADQPVIKSTGIAPGVVVSSKITLDFTGPEVSELGSPNPFLDYRMTVEFSQGDAKVTVPGYFAADGNASESSEDSGNVWRAHFWTDAPGEWTYRVSFVSGEGVAINDGAGMAVEGIDGKTGSFTVEPNEVSDGGLFARNGRLKYVGKHFLQFSQSKKYFIKAGPDAPETLLAYTDFDGTSGGRKNAPLKTWQPHVQDFADGDPTWKDGKGKGLLGAINYLSAKGVNAMSFLTYNAGGDGNNVWPHVSREDKLHFDCSKLDQWAVVFDHAQAKGIFLHVKLQETENDDLIKGHKGEIADIPDALDDGDLGVERKLYLREIVARFGYLPGLEWNLGEENTQSVKQQKEMASYLDQIDAFDHSIVIHTYPGQQDKVYQPLLGEASVLTGASLQNMWSAAHARTFKWVTESRKAGRAWVVVNDEQGSADQGVPPDPGYKGFSGTVQMKNRTYDMHDIRKSTLWGTIMAGGAGVNYYFGYKLLENDLQCEDFRSREKQWDFCRIALEFFENEQIPFEEMTCRDELIGNKNHDNSKYCLAKQGQLYLVYLPEGGETSLDLKNEKGEFSVQWFNPREGGKLQTAAPVSGGSSVMLKAPKSEARADWLAVISATSH